MNSSLNQLLYLVSLFVKESVIPKKEKVAEEASHSIISPRIIGGDDADESRYPYFVFLKRGNLCGGILIGPNLVLTAAHVSARRER